MKKDTIYIDVEDDITSVIEKLKASDDKIVAIVPPKRSSVLSSVVNLKLINKSAHEAGRRVVLITTDKTLISLAGGIGMYVAPNLQSAPAIPAVTAPPEEIPSEVIKEADTPAAPPKKFSVLKAVGAFAGSKIQGVPDKGDSENPNKNSKTDKALRVPNFNLFKKKLLLIVLGAILLIAGSVWAFYWAPSARISIEGQTNRIGTEAAFTADTAVQTADFAAKQLPAVIQELKKEASETATPTGQKNIGQKAQGEVSLKNCEKHANTVTLPAGTALTSSGLTFLTEEAVTLPASAFNGIGVCTSPSKDVGVIAQHAGDQYNLSARSYTVSGHPDIAANGSAMSGGTNEIVKIVSQADIDGAREAALAKLREGTKEVLTQQFGTDLYAIDPSYTETLNEVTPSVPVGERADTLSVKAVVTFSVLGVKKDVLTEYLKEIQQPSLKENQVIFNTGLDSAQITRTEAPAPSKQVFHLKTDGFAGPDVNIDELRSELAGKGFGEAKEHIESIPGVTKADIDFSPFWVFAMPRRADQITVDIKVN